MTVPRHLDEAAGRLEEAAERIDVARTEPPSADAMRQWLEALTDYTLALSDLHRFTNESIHEKLHEIAARLRVEDAIEAAGPSRFPS